MRIEFLCLSNRGIRLISTVQHWMHVLKLVMQQFLLCNSIRHGRGLEERFGCLNVLSPPLVMNFDQATKQSQIHSFLLFLVGWHFVLKSLNQAKNFALRRYVNIYLCLSPLPQTRELQTSGLHTRARLLGTRIKTETPRLYRLSAKFYAWFKDALNVVMWWCWSDIRQFLNNRQKIWRRHFNNVNWKEQLLLKTLLTLIETAYL